MRSVPERQVSPRQLDQYAGECCRPRPMEASMKVIVA